MECTDSGFKNLGEPKKAHLFERVEENMGKQGFQSLTSIFHGEILFSEHQGSAKPGNITTSFSINHYIVVKFLMMCLCI